MRSSTSNSSRVSSGVGLDFFTIILLSAVVVLLTLVEGVTAMMFDSTSRVQRREVSQRQALLKVADSSGAGSAHLAVFGNSLLLEGLDVPALDTQIQPKAIPVPYFVLATNYYDWYFGLKRLFAEGMRPRYVLLGLSPNQLSSALTRGDYAARYLFQRQDLINIVRMTHMDATTASEFLLSHYSEYYATREVTRGYIMKRVLPSVADLLHTSQSSYRDPEIEEGILKKLAAERLSALSELCRANGSRFIFVIPPSYQKGAETIARVGNQLGVTVLVPVSNDELDASYYETDEFHLNEKGARIFTTRLARDLNRELTN